MLSKHKIQVSYVAYSILFLAEKAQKEGSLSTALKARREELPVTTSGNEAVCAWRIQIETPAKKQHSYCRFEAYNFRGVFVGAEKTWAYREGKRQNQIILCKRQL